MFFRIQFLSPEGEWITKPACIPSLVEAQARLQQDEHLRPSDALPPSGNVRLALDIGEASEEEHEGTFGCAGIYPIKAITSFDDGHGPMPEIHILAHMPPADAVDYPHGGYSEEFPEWCQIQIPLCVIEQRL